MMARTWVVVGALLGAAFHLVTVLPALLVRETGDLGQMILVFLLDMPLFLLLKVLPGGAYILEGPPTTFILFFSIAGTLMYAVVGAIIGYGLARLFGAVGARDGRTG
jgi:hypothetical protein